MTTLTRLPARTGSRHLETEPRFAGITPGVSSTNFAWAEGYKQGFGLVHVDSTAQKRTIKLSGTWYAEVARANALPA